MSTISNMTECVCNKAAWPRLPTCERGKAFQSCETWDESMTNRQFAVGPPVASHVIIGWAATPCGEIYKWPLVQLFFMFADIFGTFHLYSFCIREQWHHSTAGYPDSDPLFYFYRLPFLYLLPTHFHDWLLLLVSLISTSHWLMNTANDVFLRVSTRGCCRRRILPCYAVKYVVRVQTSNVHTVAISSVDPVMH